MTDWHARMMAAQDARRARGTSGKGRSQRIARRSDLAHRSFDPVLITVRDCKAAIAGAISDFRIDAMMALEGETGFVPF